jgi:hypothetical protein
MAHHWPIVVVNRDDQCLAYVNHIRIHHPILAHKVFDTYPVLGSDPIQTFPGPDVMNHSPTLAWWGSPDGLSGGNN